LKETGDNLRMRLTTLLGEIQVEEKDMIDFPSGIPGFDHLRKFVILQPEAAKPFAFLQSVEEKDLSFIVADPFEFYPGYEFTLAEADQQFLEVSAPEDVAVYCIVTAKTSLAEATMNLLAPVVINISKRIGKQIVLHCTGYKTKHPLSKTGQPAAKEDHSCSY